MLLWGQDKTAQEEERGQTHSGLFTAFWSGTQLPRAAHGCPAAAPGYQWASPQLPQGPTLPPQGYYHLELTTSLITKELDSMIFMGPFQLEVVCDSMTCTRQLQ